MRSRLSLSLLALLASCAFSLEAGDHEMSAMSGDGAGSAGDPQPAYTGGSQQQQKSPSEYARYDNSAGWGQQGQAQSWNYQEPQAAAGGQAAGFRNQQQAPASQRRQDKKRGGGQALQQQGQGPYRRRQQGPPAQYNADYYDEYDTNEEQSFSLMDYVPQGLRRVFSGVSSWMSRMDGSTVAAGALTAFALGVAAAMGTAGLSGVAVAGRKLADRFDLTWDRFAEIQNVDAVSRVLDFLEIDDEVCRQKAVCEVEQKVAMRNVFLWYTMRAVSGYIPGMDKYQEAAVMALEGHNCNEVYPGCPDSVVDRIGKLSWTGLI